MVSYGEKEKVSINRMRVRKKIPSRGTTNDHHSANLVMANGDHRDRFFHPTLTLMIDSYNIQVQVTD